MVTPTSNRMYRFESQERNRSNRFSVGLPKAVRKTTTKQPERKRGGAIATPAWQKDVVDEIKKRGWKQEDLARKVHCAQSSLNDVLTKPNKSSRIVGDINRLFGWHPPPELPGASAVPLPSSDAV